MDIPKVLITGSAGLIGSLLTKQLVSKGIQVIELDTRISANSPGHGDVRDSKLLNQLIKDCQGVIHLAAVSRVVWGEQNPQLCWDVNVQGTHNLLKAAYQAPQKPWIILASSREVYGQQTILPITEEAELMPLNTYARSKVEGEKLVNEYRQQGLKTAILRFSSVYGSANDYSDRVIPAFCRAAVAGKTLRIDGFNNLFDFTHVADTVNGIIHTVNKLQAGVQDLPPIHLTTGYATSLLQVIKLIEQTLEETVQYQEAPARTYDVHHFYGNPARAKQLLGWDAHIPLAQGIKDLIKQYQQHSSMLMDYA